MADGLGDALDPIVDPMLKEVEQAIEAQGLRFFGVLVISVADDENGVRRANLNAAVNEDEPDSEDHDALLEMLLNACVAVSAAAGREFRVVPIEKIGQG